MILFDSISITQAKHEEDVFVVTVVECKVVPFHCYIISVVWLWRIRKFWDKNRNIRTDPDNVKSFSLIYFIFFCFCLFVPQDLPKMDFMGESDAFVKVSLHPQQREVKQVKQNILSDSILLDSFFSCIGIENKGCWVVGEPSLPTNIQIWGWNNTTYHRLISFTQTND